MTVETKNQILKLKRQNASLREISRTLGAPLSSADYELVEVTIANKYRISRKSVVRMHFLLKRCGSGFEID
jgi:hypothetical protein